MYGPTHAIIHMHGMGTQLVLIKLIRSQVSLRLNYMCPTRLSNTLLPSKDSLANFFLFNLDYTFRVAFEAMTCTQPSLNYYGHKGSCRACQTSVVRIPLWELTLSRTLSSEP